MPSLVIVLSILATFLALLGNACFLGCFVRDDRTHDERRLLSSVPMFIDLLIPLSSNITDNGTLCVCVCVGDVHVCVNVWNCHSAFCFIKYSNRSTRCLR